MQFSINPERLRQIIAEEVTKFYVDETFLNEQEAFVLAADKAADEGQDTFEFPPGSGKMHKVSIKTDIQRPGENGRKKPKK